MYKNKNNIFKNKTNKISYFLAITLFSYISIFNPVKAEQQDKNPYANTDDSPYNIDDPESPSPSPSIENKPEVLPTPSKSPEKIKDNLSEIKKMKDSMLKFGLENIEVKKITESNQEKSEYVISYENRTFLHEIHLLGALLSDFKGTINDNSHITFYPQSNGKVVIKIELEYQDYLDFKNKTITEEELAKKLSFVMNPVYEFSNDRTNPLMFHTDFVLNPAYLLTANYGPLIVFAPYVTMNLDKGFSLSTRYRVPIYNIVNGFDFTKNSALFAPSFGYTSLDYSSQIVNNIPLYSTLKLGYIYENQGHNAILSNELQYMLFDGLVNINMATGVNFNGTNKAVDFSITPYGQLYINKVDLVLEAGAGKFLYNEYGFWGRATRQFDNVDLGFSIYKTFGQTQSGYRMNVEYNIAIGPEHSINAAPARVTWPRFFSGSLVAGQNTAFSVAKNKTEDYIKRLYPEYIKSHLYYWLNY